MEDTRERLLAAAGTIFAEKGYEAATVRDICQQAEANLAAVNYYFGDKERHYLESVTSSYCRRQQTVPLPEWPTGTEPAVQLRGFIQTMLERMIKDPTPSWHVKLLMREVLQPTGACRELVKDFIRPHFELLLSILNEMLPAAVPAEQRHLIGFSIIGQCLHHRVAATVVRMLVGEEEYSTYTPQRLAEHIAQFSLAALGRGCFPTAKEPPL